MLVPALLSAGFALTTQAFLLPPEAAKTFDEAKNKVASHVIDPFSRTVALDCSNCPYALASQRKGRHEWTNDIKSDLQLKFTAENDKLMLNGVPFYPVTPPFTPAPLLAKQIKKTDEGNDVFQEGYDRDLSLSYSLEFDNNKKHFPAPGQDATLTEITLSILGLDNEVVHVDDIKIKALSIPAAKNINHELMIVSVDTQPTDQNAADAQCGTILCRVTYKFKSAVRKAQAHAKMAAHKLFSFVILPVLVGIVFGVVASAIGMIVGQIIVAIWLRLRRRSSTAVAYAPIATEEKEGLPKYEDLEDTKTVVEEKV
ncbi:MAG: hypothetical protein Q9218_001465 [Villophora microphyllina]